MIESRIRELLEYTADAAFVVDAQGLTRSWNGSAEKLFGLPACKAIGQPCARLLAGRDALEALVCVQECPVLKCVTAGRPVPNFDLQVASARGHKRWVNISILAFHDRSGNRFSLHLLRDITARKKTEQLAQELLESARALVSLVEEPAPQAPAVPLTAQEIRVLRTLAEGISASAAAARLGISQRTVRNHLYNVNRKLGTTSLLQAIRRAERSGLIRSVDLAPRSREGTA